MAPIDFVLIFAILGAGLLIGFAAALFLFFFIRRQALHPLLCETPHAPDQAPKASLARLQLLIFTFIIALTFLLLSVENGTLIDIPNSVLGLLIISAATYGLSKYIDHVAHRNSLGHGAAQGASSDALNVPPPIRDNLQ